MATVPDDGLTHLRVTLSETAYIGPGRADLLEQIALCGSISAAGKAMGMSLQARLGAGASAQCRFWAGIGGGASRGSCAGGRRTQCLRPGGFGPLSGDAGQDAPGD
ncbi:hypothetical protein PSQ19_10245 [Devosia algicola]|uniref:Uncharacterized protein n=1 Tax=Devosia algicola TaxID=3026418 RepID=A0ABY7YIV3_9HYPH|nr:hypothetical protein [Devosia algicola]WDR01238.1 hypothetical protein PSQ19_10245 [Devosia algicola]